AGLTFAAVSIRSSGNYAAGSHPILLLFFLLTLFLAMPCAFQSHLQEHPAHLPTCCCLLVLCAGKMHNLSSDSAATESYSDYDPHKENSMREDAQGSSPTDCKEGNDSFEMGKGTHELIPPLESNELPG